MLWMYDEEITTCLQDAPKKFSPFLLVPLLSRVHFDRMICQYSLIGSYCVWCVFMSVGIDIIDTKAYLRTNLGN